MVIAAGDSIALYHQRILGFAWAGLLIVPAIFVPMLIVLLPWTAGTDLKVAQPANAMGRFFADSFERRTGQPLAVVTGDPRPAALVALAAPSRPSVFFDADPARSPWVTADDIRKKGAVVVWLAADTTPSAAARHQGVFSRSRRRSAARLRSAGAGPAADVVDRLGRDQAGQRDGGGALGRFGCAGERSASFAMTSVIRGALADLAAEQPIRQRRIAEYHRQQD